MALMIGELLIILVMLLSIWMLFLFDINALAVSFWRNSPCYLQRYSRTAVVTSITTLQTFSVQIGTKRQQEF